MVDWVNQPALLAHPSVKVFVTHGGASSVHEAIRFRKPIVCVPYFADQPSLCARVVEAGIGVAIPQHNVNMQTLTDGLTAALSLEYAPLTTASPSLS